VSKRRLRVEMARSRDERMWLAQPRCPTIYSEGIAYVGDIEREDEADLLCLSADLFMQRMTTSWIPQKPILLKELFKDSGLYTLTCVLRCLRRRPMEGKVDVQVRSGRVSEERTAKFVEQLDGKGGASGLNAINIRPLFYGEVSRFVHHGRFQLLQDLAEGTLLGGKVGKSLSADVVETELEFSDDTGKVKTRNVTSHACDIWSSIKFALLSQEGAYSGPHIATPGGTYVRCFFGVKLWFFHNECDMNKDDWDGLQASGYRWQPNDKAHFAVLEEDDVLLMPPGIRMVHAVSTLESAYCEGGMFWDDQNIIQSLDALYWNCRHHVFSKLINPAQRPMNPVH